jgi:putative nucleotidyltransferase with HDIG domain
MSDLNIFDLGTPVGSSQVELQRENWALMAHANASSVMLYAKTESELIQGICAAIVAERPYVAAYVGLAEHDGQKSVRVAGIEGVAAEFARDIKVSWSDKVPEGLGPTGTCIRTGLTVVIPDAATDPRFEPWRKQVKEFDIHSIISVPIVDRNAQPIGVLGVYACFPDIFTDVEVRLFKSIASDVSIGLISLQDKQQLAEESQIREQAQQALNLSLQATIEAMSRTMDWRDPYTAKHQKRVATIAVAIARKLGWPEDRIQGLYLAAMVHDIGKLAIPAEILNKPSRLTELERQMMRGHVEAGYQILKDIPFPWPIAKMVLQHHERLDGSGYPLKIMGDEIIPESQVLAVADMLEAIASYRPYRPAKGLKVALAQIQSEAGISLNAEAVAAATSLLADEAVASELLGEDVSAI